MECASRRSHKTRRTRPIWKLSMVILDTPTEYGQHQRRYAMHSPIYNRSISSAKSLSQILIDSIRSELQTNMPGKICSVNRSRQNSSCRSNGQTRNKRLHIGNSKLSYCGTTDISVDRKCLTGSAGHVR